MTDRDWFVIDEIVQRLTIVNRGLATVEYAHRVQADLNELAENEEFRKQLVEFIQ